jgi:hypothetical protein
MVPLAMVGSFGIMAYAFLSARLGLGFAIPVGVVSGLATAAILSGPVGKALAQRLGLRQPPPPNELSDQVLGELDEFRLRIQELEERVDFSERLLARQPRAGRAAELD